MGSETLNLGLTTHLDAIERFVPIDGKRIVDVGCGDGALCRSLAERGANMLGVEPDPIQAAKNRNASLPDNIILIESVAENLPLDDHSVDAVLFQYSFHYIAIEAMESALMEAKRVVKSEGVLYITEPIAEGHHHETICHFHDETEVRRAAIEAISRYAKPHFGSETVLHYYTERFFDSFEEFASFYCGLSYNSGYSCEQVKSAPVRRSFEKAKQDTGYRFTTPVRVNRFTALRTVT